MLVKILVTSWGFRGKTEIDHDADLQLNLVMNVEGPVMSFRCASLYADADTNGQVVASGVDPRAVPKIGCHAVRFDVMQGTHTTQHRRYEALLLLVWSTSNLEYDEVSYIHMLREKKAWVPRASTMLSSGVIGEEGEGFPVSCNLKLGLSDEV